MEAAVEEAYADYSAARKRLVALSPCPKCCPPRHPCSPGEYICGSDILWCKKCGGDGFLIGWENE
jgi:hypothetical protein